MEVGILDVPRTPRPSLSGQTEADAAYSPQTIYFRRTASPVRITLFEGGHGALFDWKLGVQNHWLEKQHKGATVTVCEEEAANMIVLSRYSLAQNYPNPFNAQTIIAYDVARSGAVDLSIYALTGQLIRTLVDGDRPAGSYSVLWDGRDEAGQLVSSGVYLYRLEAGEHFVQARKALLLR